MHISFCCANTKAQPWIDGLQAALPSANGVESWSPGAAPADYAVVWAPPQQFFDEQTRLKAIFNIGAVLMTIDALSVFFWVAAMFTFWLAVENPERFRGSWCWPFTGLLIGLGFLCKYTNAFEVFSVLIVLLKTMLQRVIFLTASGSPAR